MGFIFDFDFRFVTAENWIFSLNHLFLFIFFILSMLALYYGIHTKTKKGIITTKIILAIVLVVFELGRMAWRYLERTHNGIETSFVDWVSIWSFEICAIMVWVTVAVLISSLFIRVENRTLIILKNIMFGAATMGAFLTFVFPDHIDGYRPIFHWRNFQTVITHLLLIYVPFYFVKIDEIEIKTKNLWMPALGFFGVAAINITAAHISGINFFGALNDRHVFHIIGRTVPHPLNYPIIFVLAFGGTIILYMITQFIFKDKFANDEKISQKNIKFIDVLPYITGVLLAILTLYMPMFLGSDFSKGVTNEERALESVLAILILLPFIIQIGFMYWLEDSYKEKKKIN